MPKLIMLKGLPGSGKSTWAKDVVAKDGNTKRVNKDELRAMLHNTKHSKGRENFVLAIRNSVVVEALSRDYNVIVDDTNFNPIHEKTLRDIVGTLNAFGNNITFEVKFFDTDLEECIKRDAERPNSVGKKVILGMYNQYLKPQPPEYNPDLPDAVICDLDGTLALLNGRNPYDASTCESDLLNEPVRYLVSDWRERNLTGGYIICVSGREDKYRKQTENWLDEHFAEYDYLFMRKAGDSRADYIVKREIYEEHIKGKYNIKFVVDDRPQVIRMWRSLGLFVFDVNQSGIEF